ncbi:MAG: diguanylate cyclase [Spirochaetales bacterium]|nr:diguanylate cyclase [Spirochaetales bacterium]
MDKMNILVVDDIKANLLSLEYLLEDEEIEIITAESGPEALEKTLDHDFFLILMDVEMPGMHGYETAELLRGNSKTRGIPIIFVTANSREDEQLFMGYDAGAVDYLVKPIAPRILLGKISVFKTLYRQQYELIRKTEELNGTISELEELQQELEEKNDQLRILSDQDGLTGLFNRRFFDNILEEEWSRGLRTGHPISLIMGDVDFFKQYNDTYGHLAGDECLIRIAGIFTEVIQRRVDKVARFGGEEFIAILPETDSEGVTRIASNLLSAVRNAGIEQTSSINGRMLTISLGVCTAIPDADHSFVDFLNSVDGALYEAKGKGRDCIAVRTFLPL